MRERNFYEKSWEYIEVNSDEFNDFMHKYVNNGVITATPTRSPLNSVLEQYSTEELIEAIGIDKIQNCLRKKKLESIRN
jgi:hypothetical protein